VEEVGRRATLAEVCLARGKVAEARAAAEEAARLLAETGGLIALEGRVRLVIAEARWASGAHEEARETILAAKAWLLERADRLDDPALRRRMLEAVPEHARILVRAAEWLPPAG
jgi:hypothetical protein